MKKVDISSEAITRRLRQTEQLRELCLSLMKAKKISDKNRAKEKSDAENSAQNTRDEQNRNS
jgi:hypothetical protein